ncbi:hypothetical protein D3C87_1863870 [compost metagenome]
MIRNGLIELYCLKKFVMSTIRSRTTGRPGSGRSTMRSGSSRMFVRQARPFLPLMFIASEPHTPSRHERRRARLSSTSFLMRTSASSSILSVGWSSTSSFCM